MLIKRTEEPSLKSFLIDVDGNLSLELKNELSLLTSCQEAFVFIRNIFQLHVKISKIFDWHKFGVIEINQKINKSMSLLKPLADRVLIEPSPAEEKTASGIIIPDTAKEKPLKGKIVAVGNGKPDEPMTLKVGDEVIY